ncbi:hypothetical protein OAV88_03495 [bacterium]|nr:hypothetical protein [bacterium]
MTKCLVVLLPRVDCEESTHDNEKKGDEFVHYFVIDFEMMMNNSKKLGKIF